MNKIYKVIYSKVRNCYIVVSELAKSHDDGHVRRSRSGCCRKAAVLAAFVLTTSLAVVPVWAQAATATNSGNPSAGHAVNIEMNESTSDTTDNSGTLAQGSGAYATYDSEGNLIMGKDNEVVPIQKDPRTDNARVDSKPENVVLGTRNGVGKFTHSTETKKPISGDASYAYEKLDTEWITVKVYNPDTNSYDDKQVEVYNLTPGQYMDDEYNVRAKKPIESDYSTDAQYQDALSVYNKVADYYKNDKTRQSYYVSGATAVGVDNVAEGNHSTAIGNKAKVLNSVGSFYIDKDQKLTRDSDAAYYFLKDGQITTEPQYVKNPDGSYYRDQKGYYVKTSFLTVDRLIDSSDAVAIGSDVTAEGRSAVAIGHQSYAKEYSVAIGENSVTDYMGVAIGKDNKAKYASTAIGHTNDANGYYTATMGVNNTARADESTAIGYGNSVDGQQNGGTTPKAAYTHVLGSNNTVKGNYNAVFGDTNTVTGAYALALGGHNKISGENTVGADGDYGIAIGYGNTVEKNALALGLNSNSIHDGSIAIGNQVNTTGDNNNGATDSIAIGTKASVHMKNGIVLGNEAYAGNNGNNSEGAIAIGHQAKSAAGESIAIGTQATTGNNVGSTGMTNIGAIAIGSNSTADTVYDIAMGWGANTKNTTNGGAIALGHNATIEQGGQASAAIGDSARVKENIHDAVALGSQSYAERTANNQGGYDPASGSKNHNAGSDPVWNSTLAAVSVGSSDHDVWDGTKNIHYAQQTRQITNVAAGKEDTDAVNVAQLRQVANLVHPGGGGGTGGSGVHDYSVKSVNSGTDTNYNNGGASGDNALAAGVSASATGAHSVAVGNGATAKGQDSIALGTGAVADGIGATAIGQYNTASGQNSLAFGGGYNKGQKGNTASGVASVAFGERTEASGESATAFGSDSTASGKNAAAFGENSTASGEASTAFGIGSTAAAKNSLAALGGTVDEKATNAAAIGNGAQAKLADTVALGSGSVASRARYRDLTVEAEKAAYAKGNSHGAAWEATANAIAIGNDNTVTRQLTGVAAGSLDTDAVNVAQLKKMAAEGLDFQGNNDVTVHRDLGQKLTIRGEGTKADTNYSGENLKVIGNTDGSLTIKMDKDIKGNSVTVGKKGEPGTPGKDGVDGTIGVNGKDGSAVVINGKDGSIGLKGQDGANGLTIKGADGAVGVDGTDGHDGKDGMTRIVYEDNNKITHEVATLDDGLKFGGDFGTDSAVKLNQKLTVTGGETNPDNLATANNIGVVSSQDGDNGKLELKLNKDLTGLNTVTAGTAKIGHHADGVLDTVRNGQPTGVHAKGGEFVTGLTNKEWTVKDPTYVSGRAATEDELRIVSDAVSGNTTKITNNTTQITNNTNTIAKGLSFTTNTKDASNTGENYKGYKVVKRSLGDTIAIKASDETGGHDYSTANLTTRIAENGDISILMDEKPTFTTVTTGDVIYTGNPDNKDNNGKAAQADTSVHYGDKTLTDGKNITTSDNETKATRMGYDDVQGLHHDIATMDDGQIYAGDIKTDGTLDSNGFARTMNQKTTINGGVTSKDSLTDNNIGVVSNGTDTLTVKLAKNLKDLHSVTTGKTVQDNSGIKITNNAGDETKNVIINGDQISFGGNQVNNMGSGSDGTADGKPTYNTDTNGANIGDVKNIAGSTTEAAKLTGDSNITVTYNDAAAGGKNTVKLNDSITLGSEADKKVTIDGTKGTITAGDKVSFDGSTGKGSIGGVTIGNQTGIATTKKDGDTTKTEDGTFVTGLTNTNWNPDANGIVSGRAATEDQLKTVSDTVNAGWELDVNGGKQKDVTPTSKKVNFKQGQNITITGSGDDVTVATADDVRFASVRVGGDADGNGGYTGGIVIGKQSGGASANPDENDYITGLKNINWDATKIQSGRAATEDQLKKVAEDIKQGTVSGDVYVTGGEVTYHTDGGTDNGQPTVNDGTGKLTLTENNKTTTVDITGLHDYYATSGTVSEDGKKLTIARNERDKDGNPVTFDVDLTNLLNKEKHLIANPAAGSNGVYKVNEQGEVTLQVQDAAGNNTPVTISGFEGVVDHYKGLNFDANSRKTTDDKAYNVKMGGTIKVQGIDPVSGHDYSADNVTTEVDDNGNITIKLDKALTADTVMVNGKDGKDGQIGLNGKNGTDGTVTTIIRTVGKNGTNGTDGKPGVNGTDGITRIIYQDGKDGEPGTTTHTVATLDDGLKFGANTPAAGKTDNPVGNKLNSTINIKGAGTKTLDQYSGQNLITSVEQDADGNTTINVLMDKALTADTVMVNGKDGKDGQIGLNGKNGTDGTVTTIIRTVGKNGTNGTDGKPGVNGTDGITRIIYQDGKDGESGTTTHTVATLDDGLKFAGDDGQTDTTKVISKKLNEQLDIVGKATGELTDNNIGVKNADGKLYVRLAKHVDLDKDGTLKAGNATFGAFSNTELTTNKNNHPSAGSYATGLSNKGWSVADPEYVSGRAATEDQLKVVSDAIHNRQLVNTDYQLVANPDTKTDGSYTAENGTLTLTVRDTEHTDDPKYPDKTITIKDIASKTKVDEAYDRTVKYDMKDGKVDKTHVTFEAADEAGNPLDTQVSHMASGASEITDDGKGNKTYTYNTENNAANVGDVKRLAAEADLHYSGDTGTGTSQLKDTVAFNGTEGQIVTAAENGKVTFKLADDLTTQTITVTGKDGKDGQIGISGKDGADGKVTTIIKTIGKNGADGKPGTPGVNGTDGITRIIYQDGKDGEAGTTTHTMATLDDGLKFHGDSGDIVTRKLNTQLDVLGGQTDTAKLTDGNIGVVSTKAADENSNGKLEIRLAKELKGLTSVQAGDTTIDGNGLKIEKAGKDSKGDIIINKTTVSMAGNQITNMGSGLGNTYTAAGDNNGANIGDVKKIADGRRTTVKSTDGSVSVVDRNTNDPNATSHDYDLSVDTSKVAKTVDLKYKGDNNTEGSNKLSDAVTFSGTANQIVTKAEDGKVTFKLADNVTTQTITAVGQDGKDGQIGLTGKNGADGSVTTIIKTVGAKGTDGKDGIPGVDGQPGKDGITRLMYDETDDKGGTEHHVVATLDDGLKFVGNDVKVVTRKLNDTLSIKGGIDDAEMLADAQRVSSRNLGVRQNTAKDGLEIVMTNRPDFEAITVGPDGDDPAHKITIGQQDNKEGNPNPTKGNYITGLDNTQWDAGNVVADRAATEGQLSQAITDISGKDKGGFGLADEKGNTVKKDLGETIAVKGDGKNIETKVNGDALEVSLKKDVVLGDDGSLKAGNTTINGDGVETNKVKVGNITITDQGINGGSKQITNIGSGIDGKKYADAGDNNAASIGDVKQLAKNEAKASEAKSGKNITVKDDHTVNLNDDIILGNDSNKQVAINGSNGQVVIGSGDSAMTLGKQANTAGDSNPENGNYLNGLDNKKWDGEHIQSGRAATEDQLKTVSDKVNSGRKFQGDDGKDVTVDLGKTLNIKGGATAVSDANNIGIVRGDDNTLNVRLAKDLTGLNSVTTGNTTINNSGLTVKGDDNHKDITIQQDNVNMGGNKITGVAPGAVTPDSTDAVNGSQLYAAGQAISNLGGAVNKLGTRVDRVGAGAAALAALHPLDFDPDDKWDFAAGYGNYRGANAAAVGAYYRPNEDTMFSIGGSFGGGENMVNAGVSFKLGQGNHVSTSRVAMAKEIKDLRENVAQLNQIVNRQSALIEKLTSVDTGSIQDKGNDLFPDVPENHWAYEYVTKLAKAGILKGYPDGKFAGDRMMTRYEFAAIVYRAITMGAASDPGLNQDGTLGKLAKEFNQELKFIRIDTIHQTDQGEPTVQRVRVQNTTK